MAPVFLRPGPTRGRTRSPLRAAIANRRVKLSQRRARSDAPCRRQVRMFMRCLPRTSHSFEVDEAFGDVHRRQSDPHGVADIDSPRAPDHHAFGGEFQQANVGALG